MVSRSGRSSGVGRPSRPGTSARSSRVTRPGQKAKTSSRSPAGRSRGGGKSDPYQTERYIWVAVNLVLSLVLLASMTAAGAFGYWWFEQRQVGNQHEAAIAAARQTVVDFLTISARSVDKDLEQVSQGATGNFKEEFDAGKAEVRDTVNANKVDSRGNVLRAGLVGGDGDSAVVLVAVDARVKNENAPEGRKAHYRIEVEMSYHEESDRWLVAELRFVG